VPVGTQLAKAILQELDGSDVISLQDSSTNGLINHYKANKQRDNPNDCKCCFIKTIRKFVAVKFSVE
jgi:hypothetical protein